MNIMCFLHIYCDSKVQCYILIRTICNFYNMNKIIQKENEGLIYSIKSIERSGNLQCSKSCFYYKDKEPCSYVKNCNRIGIKCNNKHFSCIELHVNVKNLGIHSDWVIGSEDIVMIDSEGYSYPGLILCPEMLPFRISEERTHVLPGTQVDYIELFPELPNGITYSKFLINIHNRWFEFEYSSTKLDSLSEPNEASGIYGGAPLVHRDINSINHEMDIIKQDIVWLKTDIYSCLNNELTNQEMVKLDNHIKRKFYTIKLTLENKHESCFKSLKEDLERIEDEYKNQLSQRKNSLARNNISKTIEELLELDPREFEEYIGQLYKSMGYQTEVTPYSNDKGVDVIMYKDDVKYVIQCKRYKGTVGSPDIQKFIGALDHSKADKGIFVTTGMFSFEAEKMAKEHPIILVNRITLAKMIINQLK